MHKPGPRSWRGIQIITKYVQKHFVGKLPDPWAGARHVSGTGTTIGKSATYTVTHACGGASIEALDHLPWGVHRGAAIVGYSLVCTVEHAELTNRRFRQGNNITDTISYCLSLWLCVGDKITGDAQHSHERMNVRGRRPERCENQRQIGVLFLTLFIIGLLGRGMVAV
ncbi:hypothetical protein EDB84DRAFT_1466263 [Lactarius hengduanensis]|nr:hypothetical protein EDB84DRAFT_1466263 [Lactarius hengduanensis]